MLRKMASKLGLPPFPCTIHFLARQKGLKDLVKRVQKRGAEIGPLSKTTYLLVLFLCLASIFISLVPITTAMFLCLSTKNPWKQDLEFYSFFFNLLPSSYHLCFLLFLPWSQFLSSHVHTPCFFSFLLQTHLCSIGINWSTKFVCSTLMPSDYY